MLWFLFEKAARHCIVTGCHSTCSDAASNRKLFSITFLGQGWVGGALGSLDPSLSVSSATLEVRLL